MCGLITVISFKKASLNVQENHGQSQLLFASLLLRIPCTETRLN